MSAGNTRFDRRVFLRRGALVAGAAAAVAVVPGPLVSDWGSGDEGGQGVSAVGDDLSGLQPMVAYVRDAAAGEVIVMAGTREVVVSDRLLVAKLLQAQRAMGKNA